MGASALDERHRLPDEFGQIDALQDVINDVLGDHRAKGSRETPQQTTAEVHSYV